MDVNPPVETANEEYFFIIIVFIQLKFKYTEKSNLFNNSVNKHPIFKFKVEHEVGGKKSHFF